MNPPAQSEKAASGLAEILFNGHDAGVFAVLDGASVPKLAQILHEHNPENCCLYPGELKPDMAAVAPYLVRLEPGKEFTQLILREGWGVHWGIFVTSASDLRSLRDHFREFHKVELPDQRTVIFRYYDPRVLRIFLPVCNEAELALFFGPVASFILESEAPEVGVRFLFASPALKTEPFQLKKAQ
jgi:hypothetical protein